MLAVGELNSRCSWSSSGGEAPALADLDQYSVWQAIEHNVAEQAKVVDQMKAGLLAAARCDQDSEVMAGPWMSEQLHDFA